MNPLWILAAIALAGKKNKGSNPPPPPGNPGNPGSTVGDDPLDRL